LFSPISSILPRKATLSRTSFTPANTNSQQRVS
jgi:hypothetical protein